MYLYIFKYLFFFLTLNTNHSNTESLLIFLFVAFSPSSFSFYNSTMYSQRVSPFVFFNVNIFISSHVFTALKCLNFFVKHRYNDFLIILAFTSPHVFENSIFTKIPTNSWIHRKMDHLFLLFSQPQDTFLSFVVLHIKNNHLSPIICILFSLHLRRENCCYWPNELPFPTISVRRSPWFFFLRLSSINTVSGILPKAWQTFTWFNWSWLRDSSLLFFLLFFK